jgi:hypothetical protein
VKYGGHVARAEARICDALPEIVDNMLALARGVLVEKHTQEGEVVYRTPPDYKALRYLIDRILGKPVERVEHGGTLEPDPRTLTTAELVDRARAMLARHAEQPPPPLALAPPPPLAEPANGDQ